MLVPLFLEYVFLLVALDVLPEAERKRDLEDEIAFTALLLLPVLDIEDLLPALYATPPL